MLFINGDYFETDLGEGVFDAFITDIPYKSSQKGRYHEAEFSFDRFFQKTYKEAKEDAVLITFSNEKCMLDLRLFCESNGWHYHSLNVWFKPSIHNPTSEFVPLKNCEFILYFYKGNGNKMLNFKNGSRYKFDKPRQSSLYTDRPCKNTHGYGQYQMVLQLSVLPSIKKYKKAKAEIKNRFPGFPTGWKRCRVMVGNTRKCFAPEKPIGFSWFFWNLLMGEKWDSEKDVRLPRRNEITVCDPFTGTGALLAAFPDGIGVDISREQLDAARGLNGANGVQIEYHPDYPVLLDSMPLDSSEVEGEECAEVCGDQPKPSKGLKQSKLI